MDYDEDDSEESDQPASSLGRSKRSFQVVSPTKLRYPDVKTSTSVQMKPSGLEDGGAHSKVSLSSQSLGPEGVSPSPAAIDQEHLLKSVLEGMIDLIRKKNASLESSKSAIPLANSNPVLMVPVMGERLNNLGLHKTLVNYGGKMMSVLKPKSAR